MIFKEIKTGADVNGFCHQSPFVANRNKSDGTPGLRL